LKDDRQCDRKDMQKSGEDHGFKIGALFSDTIDANWVLCTPVILVIFIEMDHALTCIKTAPKSKIIAHPGSENLLNERAFLDFLLNVDLALKRADVLRIDIFIQRCGECWQFKRRLQKRFS
jgi:hypothetical protein